MDERNKLLIFGRNPIATLLWICWILFLILIAWQARYWINNDTIGSIDSSRAIRSGNIIAGLNGIWGTGYAFLLALLPLKNISSWFQTHLLLSALILATQAIIYPTLRHTGATPLVATLLLIIWGSSCFITGGTLYATADTALTFTLALLIAWASRFEPRTTTAAFTLGILHGLAGMTKSIALLGFGIIPVLIFLSQGATFGFKVAPFSHTFSRTKVAPRSQRYYLILIRPILAYGAAISLMVCLWFGWSMTRYGRFTLSDTGAYNYAAYVAEPAAFQPAITAARLTLPPQGTTYWWSDPSTTLSQWDWETTFDVPAQIKAITNNIRLTLSMRNLIVSGTSILLFIGGGIMFGRAFKTRSLRFTDWLWLCTLVMLGLYMLTNFRPRFWPAITLFTLPLCARGLKRPNRMTTAGLSIIALVSIIATLLITHQFAPNNAHFAVRDHLATRNINTIGFHRTHGNMMYHSSVVARLLDRQTADIIPLPNTSPTRYAATFTPDVVLLSTRTEPDTTILVDVGQLVNGDWKSEMIIEYTQDAQFEWRGSAEDTLTLFTP